MRTREEFLARFEELRSRRLSQRKEKFLSRSHMNCMYNVRLRVRGHGKLGFCRNPEVIKKVNGGPVVCDEEGTCKRCPLFNCRNTVETVERDFEEVLASPAQCGNEYPKLAVMIWSLQDTSRRSRRDRLLTGTRELFRATWALITFRWW